MHPSRLRRAFLLMAACAMAIADDDVLKLPDGVSGPVPMYLCIGNSHMRGYVVDEDLHPILPEDRAAIPRTLLFQGPLAPRKGRPRKPPWLDAIDRPLPSFTVKGMGPAGALFRRLAERGTGWTIALLSATDSTGVPEWRRGGRCFEALNGADGQVTVAQRLLVDTGQARWAGLVVFAFGAKAADFDAMVADWRSALKSPQLPVAVSIPAYANDPDVVTVGQRLERVAFIDNGGTNTRCQWHKEARIFDEGDMHWNMRCNRTMGRRAADTLLDLAAGRPTGYGRTPWTAEPVCTVDGLAGVGGVALAPTHRLYAVHAQGGTGAVASLVHQAPAPTQLLRPQTIVDKPLRLVGDATRPLRRPSAVIAVRDRLYVADGDRIVVFAIETSLFPPGHPANPKGTMPPEAPQAVIAVPGARQLAAFASSGTTIFAADPSADAVFAIDLRRGGSKRGTDVPLDELAARKLATVPGAAGLAVRSGTLWVASQGRHDLFAVDPTGAAEPRARGIAGLLKRPAGLDVMVDGRLLLADAGAGALLVVDPDAGTVERLIEIEGVQGVTVSRKQGVVYATRPAAGAIAVLRIGWDDAPGTGRAVAKADRAAIATVEAVAVRTSAVPGAKDLAAYTEALVCHEYRVERVISGAFPAKRLVAIEMALSKLKPLPAAGVRPGQRRILTIALWEAWRAEKSYPVGDDIDEVDETIHYVIEAKPAEPAQRSP